MPGTNQEYRGLWWLPDKPDARVAGSLRVADNGESNLELIGRLIDTVTLKNVVAFPVVLGYAMTLGDVTLRDCMLTRRSTTAAGESGLVLSVESYRAGAVFTGKHFARDEDLHFRKMDVGFGRLAEWLGFAKLSDDSGPSAARVSAGGMAFDAKMESKVAALPGGKIGIARLPSTTFGSYREFSLRDTVTFYLSMDAHLHFDDWVRRYVLPLQNLLTLATNEPNSIEGLKFVVECEEGAQSNAESLSLPCEVKASFFTSRVGPRDKTHLHPRDLFFSFAQLPDGFERALNKWICVSDELSDVCNLFFSTVYENLFAEQRLLSLTQAAEVYHRHRFGKKYSLRQRVELVLGQLSPALSDIVGDTKAFSAMAQDTRDYYAHYRPSDRERAAKGHELFLLTQQMSYLVRACLLNEIGFSSDDVRQLLASNRSYEYLAKTLKGNPE